MITAFGLTSILQTYGTLIGRSAPASDNTSGTSHQPELLFWMNRLLRLDIQTRTVISQTLNQLRQQQGLTIILTTPYLEEAAEADFVYVIDHGQIIAADTVEQPCRKQPMHKVSWWLKPIILKLSWMLIQALVVNGVVFTNKPSITDCATWWSTGNRFINKSIYDYPFWISPVRPWWYFYGTNSEIR